MTVTYGVTRPLHVALQSVTCSVTGHYMRCYVTVTYSVTYRYMQRYRALHVTLQIALQNVTCNVKKEFRLKNSKPLQKSSGVFTPELFA